MTSEKAIHDADRPPHGLGFVYAKLRNATKEAGSQSAFAAKHCMSPAYVSDVLNARRDPGDSILAALGLRKVVGYVEKRNSEG